MKSKKETVVVMSISFPPGMLEWVDTSCGHRARSAWCIDAVDRVCSAETLPFRPVEKNVRALEAATKRALKKQPKGMPGKETWNISRSLSFPPDLMAWIDAHRARMGIGNRSRYVMVCLEHVHGIRPHPELFEPSLRP